jgi:hypothetical protein
MFEAIGGDAARVLVRSLSGNRREGLCEKRGTIG